MKQPFTIYRIVRIDGQFDTEKHESVDEAITEATQKVINDALSHKQTIDNGIEITDIVDCGESC